MWKSALAVSHKLAHQKPSFHHSLLWGFEALGALPEPVEGGPSKPTSPGADWAVAGKANARPRTTKSTTGRYRRRTVLARWSRRGAAPTRFDYQGRPEVSSESLGQRVGPFSFRV